MRLESEAFAHGWVVNGVAEQVENEEICLGFCSVCKRGKGMEEELRNVSACWCLDSVNLERFDGFKPWSNVCWCECSGNVAVAPVLHN